MKKSTLLGHEDYHILHPPSAVSSACSVASPSAAAAGSVGLSSSADPTSEFMSGISDSKKKHFTYTIID